ncbi:MAG: hypothetical protein ACYSW3_22475 [Planctomycetota bacterium]|jgi:hypothetical protein
MNIITVAALIQLITDAATSGRATIVTILATTDPKVKKGSKRGQPAANRFYGRTEKRSVVNGIVNWKYSNAVNNQRAREHEGDISTLEHFEPAPRKWGVRLEGLPFVEHKDKLYLELKVQRSLGHEYYATDTGELLPTDEVEQCLPVRKASSRQGVEKEVILRDYDVNSITGIRIGGEEYTVSAAAAAA